MMMNPDRLIRYFRISAPAAQRIPAGEADAAYRRLRSRTFWGVTAAYSLYYICRMALSVVKQPVIDEGLLTAGQLMSGLLVGAGVGILVMVRTNHHQKENAAVICTLWGLGVAWGILIDLMGITF